MDGNHTEIETNSTSVVTQSSSINSTQLADLQDPVPTEPVELLDPDTLNVVVIPLVVIAVLIAFAALIFCFIRSRSARQQRRTFTPVYYSVEHDESGNEWESQLVDEEMAKHVNIVKSNRGNQARLMMERGGST